MKFKRLVYCIVLQLKYSFKVFLYLPITFLKRVAFGKDPYWTQYFWNKWGFISNDLIELAEKRKTIWLYAMSGGEVTQIFTFCKLLRKEFPTYNLILSSNSYDALKLAKKIKELDYVFDPPWDISFIAKRVIKKVKPLAYIVIEQLHDPVFLIQAKKMGIQTIMVSGFMSKRWWENKFLKRALTLDAFNYFDYIAVKDKQDIHGFKRIGVDSKKISIQGNMKYDIDFINISQDGKNKLLTSLKLSLRDIILIAGSIYKGEYELIVDAYISAKREIPLLRLILVSRYNLLIPSIESYLNEKGIASIRRSYINEDTSISDKVIIVDTFGELGRFYSIASYVVIGGSISVVDQVASGNNIIEPIIHGKPVFFGQYMNCYREITEELKLIWDGLEIKRPEELSRGIIYLNKNSIIKQRLSEKSAEIVNRHSNDIIKNINFVSRLIKKVSYD